MAVPLTPTLISHRNFLRPSVPPGNISERNVHNTAFVDSFPWRWTQPCHNFDVLDMLLWRGSGNGRLTSFYQWWVVFNADSGLCDPLAISVLMKRLKPSSSLSLFCPTHRISRGKSVS